MGLHLNPHTLHGARRRGAAPTDNDTSEQGDPEDRRDHRVKPRATATWEERGSVMSDPIDESAVALALMREALSLLDTEETAIAADHLRRAIKAITNLPPHTDLGGDVPPAP